MLNKRHLLTSYNLIPLATNQVTPAKGQVKYVNYMKFSKIDANLTNH